MCGEGSWAYPPMPDTELEEMLIRMFAPRPLPTSLPDDPARLDAILKEWNVVISLIRQGYGHLFEPTPDEPLFLRPLQSAT
jgi:hypothetical protein